MIACRLGFSASHAAATPTLGDKSGLSDRSGVGDKSGLGGTQSLPL